MPLLPPALSPGQLTSRISVRSRIIAIVIIPVIGFIANGIAFRSGETEVDAAFKTAREAARLSDASLEFKGSLNGVRMSAREFATQPSYDLVTQFGIAHDAALTHLDTIEASVSAAERADIASLRQKVEALKGSFSNLVREQEVLGFVESEGLHEKLARAGTVVERIINEDLDQVAAADAKLLLISLLTMRRYEVQYRQNRIEFVRQRFAEEVANFNRIFALVYVEPAVRDRLAGQIKTYAETFEQWAQASAKVQPWVAGIDEASQRMLPDADKIIAAARGRTSEASALLASSQKWTRNTMLWVGLAAVVIGLCGWGLRRW